MVVRYSVVSPGLGAPAIDPRAPYGHADAHEDIAEILGIKASGEFTEEQFKVMNTLHQETAIALEIVLRTGKWSPGVYEADVDSPNWAYVKPLPQEEYLWGK
jgi:hypothetical protein